MFRTVFTWRKCVYVPASLWRPCVRQCLNVVHQGRSLSPEQLLSTVVIHRVIECVKGLRSRFYELKTVNAPVGGQNRKNCHFFLHCPSWWWKGIFPNPNFWILHMVATTKHDFYTGRQVETTESDERCVIYNY